MFDIYVDLIIFSNCDVRGSTQFQMWVRMLGSLLIDRSYANWVYCCFAQSSDGSLLWSTWESGMRYGSVRERMQRQLQTQCWLACICQGQLQNRQQVDTAVCLRRAQWRPVGNPGIGYTERGYWGSWAGALWVAWLGRAWRVSMNETAIHCATNIFHSLCIIAMRNYTVKQITMHYVKKIISPDLRTWCAWSGLPIHLWSHLTDLFHVIESSPITWNSSQKPHATVSRWLLWCHSPVIPSFRLP